jgi:hypothetical protein
MVAHKRLSQLLVPVSHEVERFTKFGNPELIYGENRADYDALLSSICGAVKPADFIEEMLVNDIVYLQWEILRLRRLKTSYMKLVAADPLETALTAAIPYDDYKDTFVKILADRLQQDCGQTGDCAYELARLFAGPESDSDQKVRNLLDEAELDIDQIYAAAKREKVEELAEGYKRQESPFVEQVKQILAARGQSMEDVIVEGLTRKEFRWDTDKLAHLERLEDLITLAESRRNAALREIDLHRATLAQRLRRTVPDIDGADYSPKSVPKTNGA